MNAHLLNRKYSCEQCEKSFRRKSDLARHSHKHSKKPIVHECDICDKVFGTLKTLNRHKARHTGEKNVTCDICDRVICDKSALAKHIKRHQKKKHKCIPCGVVFGTACEFKIHRLSHPLETPFECDECSEKFTFKIQRLEHAAAVHGHGSGKPILPDWSDEMEPKIVIKEECSSEYEESITEDEPMIPMDVNVKIEVKAEPLDDISVPQYDEINHSPANSNPDIPASTDDCNPHLDDTEQLLQHTVMHLNEKKFKCPKCPASFFLQSVCSEHVHFQHSGPKPYKCELCNTRFTTSSGLTEHELTSKHMQQLYHISKIQQNKTQD